MINIILILSIILNVCTAIYCIWDKTHKRKAMDKQEELSLTFFKGRDDMVISRTAAGKVCLLDMPYCKKNYIYVKESQEWRCMVKEEKQSCVVVQPLERLKSAEETEKIMAKQVDDLKRKFGN